MKFKLIIGLGNDEPAYANTYHNAGHLFVDYVNDRYDGLLAQKTTGYMNESGAAVARRMLRANAAPEETLIVHDESDLPLGEYKISTSRGAAGHKGVQNVFDVTRAHTFTRLRIGIRPRAADQRGTNAPRAKAGEFVLKHMSAVDRDILNGVFRKAAEELFGAPRQ